MALVTRKMARLLVVVLAVSAITFMMLNALPGVIDFSVNYSTHRARVRWDDGQIQAFSSIALEGRYGLELLD